MTETYKFDGKTIDATLSITPTSVSFCVDGNQNSSCSASGWFGEETDYSARVSHNDRIVTRGEDMFNNSIQNPKAFQEQVLTIRNEYLNNLKKLGKTGADDVAANQLNILATNERSAGKSTLNR